MKWLYDAILKPQLTYAAVVWWNRTQLKTAEGQLEKLRGLILRCVTGAVRSTPTAAPGAALCMEPLHLTIAAVAARGLLRVRKDSGENFQVIIPGVFKSGGVFKMPRDKMTKAFMFDRKYRISLAERSDWVSGREKLPTNGAIWYTDGSKRVEGTGAVVYRRRGGRGCTFPLGRYATVLQSELVGVLNWALWAEAEDGEGHLHIGTDSRSAIQALEAYTTTSRLVYNCYRTLNPVLAAGPHRNKRK